MQLKLVLLLSLLYRDRIECVRIGLIRNVNLVGQKGLEKNTTLCDECACLLLTNTTFVSFNCFLSNPTCEMFSSYNSTINYRIEDNLRSIFYFLQLPPISPTTTTLASEITTIIPEMMTLIPAVTTSPSQTTRIHYTETTSRHSAMTTTYSNLDHCPFTAVGRCNSTPGSDNVSLHSPMDVFVNRNGTILYVGDYGNNRVQAFQLPSKSGKTISASVTQVLGIYFDDDTSSLYATELGPNVLSKWPSGQTLPPTGTTTGCNAPGGWFSVPYGVVGDRYGNIYVSHNGCNTVVMWKPNVTESVLIGGTGLPGSSSQQLSSPRHIYLDEVNSFLYVADTTNNRVQRFLIGGNGTGVTVTGGHGPGTATNQLSAPAGVYVSWKDGSVYVSDRGNNRIQKWVVNATSGVTVAGRSNATAGSDASSLNNPYSVTLDRSETFMYIADYDNNRVQRVPVA